MLRAPDSRRFSTVGVLLWATGALSACGPSTSQQPAAGPAAAAASPSEANTSSLKDRLLAEDTRASAVEEAIAEYDAAARNGTTSEPAQAFVKDYAMLLTRVAVESYGSLPPKLRLGLINLLVSFNTSEVTPAFATALESYAANKQDVESAIWAARGAAAHSGPELPAALVKVWEAVEMNDRDFRRFSAHFVPALRTNAQPEWALFLSRALIPEIERPARFDDKPAVKAYQNQLFWQSTAAELLGQLKAGEYARSLVVVLLTPSKREVHGEAERALLQMGASVLPTLEALLQGNDAELVALAGSAGVAREPAAYFATRLLDQLRLPASIPMLKQAWESTKEPVTRTLIVRALSWIPGAEVAELLKQTFVGTKLDTTLPEGESALEVLAVAAANSFEHDALLPWLSERVDKVPGKGSRKGDVQRVLIESVSKLAFTKDVKPASKVAQLYGGRTGTPMFEQASRLLKECGEDVKCYRAKATDLTASSPEGTFTRIKAIWMLGMLGSPVDRAALLSTLEAPLPREVLHATLRVIEELTPTKDDAVVLGLRGVVGKLPVEAEKEAQGQRAAVEAAMWRVGAR
jgi:hypothetical protein